MTTKVSLTCNTWIQNGFPLSERKFTSSDVHIFLARKTLPFGFPTNTNRYLFIEVNYSRSFREIVCDGCEKIPPDRQTYLLWFLPAEDSEISPLSSIAEAAVPLTLAISQRGVFCSRLFLFLSRYNLAGKYTIFVCLPLL